jgi:peptidyl-prolyl cis-trans isomerase D
MSIIQRIRERGALISAIVIALALLGFIAMDAFTGRSNLFGGGPSNTMGRINGETIDANKFRQNVALTEQRMQEQGYPSGASTTQEAVNGTWDREVERIILEQEIAKVGMSVSKREMSDLLYSNNPSPVARQYFGGQEGVYDPNRTREYVMQVRKGRNQPAKTELGEVFNYIELAKLNEKFNSLLVNSINVPKWKIEKQNAENSQMAKISFVRKPYTAIPDSAVKVTDDEIRQYINKHKSDFSQEESRGISYVSFPVVASASDSADVYTDISRVKSEFESTTDITRFLAREGAGSFYDSYITGKKIQISHKDSIFKIGVGQVYGPYVDGDSYSIAKMLGVRSIPDSAKSRHILIAINQVDQRTGQVTPVRDSAAAKALIDSIAGLVRAGQNFDSLAAKFSEDPGSKNTGGVYTFSSGPPLAQNFNEFIFTNPPGTKDVVLTEFGYHFIEVLQHIGASSPAYKIAYLSNPILPSTNTENEASERASQFAGKSRDEKSFNETFEKELKAKGYNKAIAYDIKPTSYEISGLGLSRDFVRKIYDAERGEVLQPEKVGSYYVVAVVTEVNEKGTQSLAKARAAVEPNLRNEKKAEILKKQLGTITTLEAASAAWGQPIDVADSVRTTGGRNLFMEPRIIGAAFNPANKGKVVPAALNGRGAVYVIRVDNVMAAPIMDASIPDQRKAEIERAKQQATFANPLSTLKQSAKITDNRAKHY